MNDAHLHLMVNHLPIIGTVFGFLILIAGILSKNKAVKNVSYVMFIVAAIFAFISSSTGDGAKELVEDMPNISKQIIHQHEELADKLTIVLYVLSAISLLGLYTNIKNHTKANLISFVALAIGAIAVFLAQQTGTSGGEIRHTEIRSNYVPSKAESSRKEANEK